MSHAQYTWSNHVYDYVEYDYDDDGDCVDYDGDDQAW